MPGEIVLAGGEEFRPGCEGMDSAILEATGKATPQVLIVPTAAVTGPEKAASDGVRHFASLGANASQLMVLDQQHANDEELTREVSGASVIYFTGGDSRHLLATLKGSRLLARLLKELGNGALLGGSSAGAMVMGSMMWSRPSDGWIDGLGIVEGVAVLPHHEKGDPATVSQWLETKSPKGLKALGIDARTCCFGRPGSWKVLGSGKVTAYQNSSWATYASGESLPSDF